MTKENKIIRESKELHEKFYELEETYRATLNILEDFDNERYKSQQSQSALLNILEDVELERLKAEQANIQLEATNKELESFSYSVSHDLRAPLRAISGFAEAIVEDYADRLDENGKRYLGLIAENANKMGQLIDDLLSFSRLGRQEINKSQIDMKILAKTVFEELIQQIERRKIKFIVRDTDPVFGDKSMIQQVLVNLFSNAIKFTRNQKEAIIEFGCCDRIYYIRDNGVGFDMRYVDKLFGVFQRLHAVTEFEGTGVGLALVSRIITRHGGRVWAQGKINEGATFYFELPKGVQNE